MASDVWALISADLGRNDWEGFERAVLALGPEAIPILLGYFERHPALPQGRHPRDFSEDVMTALIVLGKRHPESLLKAAEGRPRGFEIDHVLEAVRSSRT